MENNNNTNQNQPAINNQIQNQPINKKEEEAIINLFEAYNHSDEIGKYLIRKTINPSDPFIQVAKRVIETSFENNELSIKKKKRKTTRNEVKKLGKLEPIQVLQIIRDSFVEFKNRKDREKLLAETQISLATIPIFLSNKPIDEEGKIKFEEEVKTFAKKNTKANNDCSLFLFLNKVNLGAFIHRIQEIMDEDPSSLGGKKEMYEYMEEVSECSYSSAKINEEKKCFNIMVIFPPIMYIFLGDKKFCVTEVLGCLSKLIVFVKSIDVKNEWKTEIDTIPQCIWDALDGTIGFDWGKNSPSKN